MIAAIVASVTGSEAVLLAIGLVLLVISGVIMLGPHSYVLYSIFITPTVVLFTSTSIADVTTTDAQRLGFTLIGAALILLASGITLGCRPSMALRVLVLPAPFLPSRPKISPCPMRKLMPLTALTGP